MPRMHCIVVYPRDFPEIFFFSAKGQNSHSSSKMRAVPKVSSVGGIGVALVIAMLVTLVSFSTPSTRYCARLLSPLLLAAACTADRNTCDTATKLKLQLVS